MPKTYMPRMGMVKSWISKRISNWSKGSWRGQQEGAPLDEIVFLRGSVVIPAYTLILRLRLGRSVSGAVARS